jgi:hypothetical protein
VNAGFQIEENVGSIRCAYSVHVSTARDFSRAALLSNYPIHDSQEVKVVRYYTVKVSKTVVAAPANDGAWQSEVFWAPQRFRKNMLPIIVF